MVNSLFKKYLLRKTYRDIYGDKATVVVKSDIVEVVFGNRKIRYGANTNLKIEETVFNENTVSVITFNEEEVAVKEKVYEGGELLYEKELRQGKATSIEKVNGIDITTSNYTESGEEIFEMVFRINDDVAKEEIDVILIEKSDSLLKSIQKKVESVIVVSSQEKIDSLGRTVFYKDTEKEVNLDYHSNGGLKRFARYIEEKVDVGTKNEGTKILKEIVEYDVAGRVTRLETNEETVTREFDSDGNIIKQYDVLVTQNGHEVVGKVIMGEDIRIINNSSLEYSKVIELNEMMGDIDKRYEVESLEMIDFDIENEDILIISKFCSLNGRLNKKREVFEHIEEGVKYRRVKFFSGEMIISERKINLISGTELCREGDTFYLKGFDGTQKEITAVEYEIYDLADKFNKIN